MDLVPGPFSASTIAALEAVAVADITNPTELNSLAGTVVGERRVAYQVVANDNLYTVYYWDSADGAGASSPYVVAGSAGYWIAAGGRYTNSAVSLRSTLLVSGAVTLSSTLGAGASTLASLIVTGAATVGTTLGVTGTSTLAGLDATSIGATTRGTGLFTTLGANGAVTFTSTLAVSSTTTIGTGLAASTILQDGASGTARQLVFRTAGSNRWAIQADSTAESGANAGSNFVLGARDDTGATIDSPIAIARVAGGAITVVRPITTSQQITSTIATGTAPLVIASTTNVPNLNASSLSGATFAAPGPIGSGTPSSGAFTTLTNTGLTTHTNTTDASASNTASVVLSGGLGVVKSAIVGSQFSVAGNPNANACITINTTTPAAIAGTTEYGMFVDFRSDSSATVATRAAFYRAGTSASAYTCAVVSAVVVGNTIVGAGSTVTRGYGINLSQQNSSTNNYGIVHSGGTPSTGNYFIYDDVGYASTVSGIWSHTDTTQASLGSGSVNTLGGLYVAKDTVGRGISWIVSTTATANLFLTNTTSGTTLTGADGFNIQMDGLNANLVNLEAGNLSLFTSGTEYMRITSAGAVSLLAVSSGLTIAKTTGTTLAVSSTATACATFAGGATFGGLVSVTQGTLGTQTFVANHDATGASTVSAATYQAGNNITSQTSAGVLDCLMGTIEASTDIFFRCRSNSSNKIMFYGDGHATFSAGLTCTTIAATSTTASTSTSTGAVVIGNGSSGGLGVGGSIYGGGKGVFASTLLVGTTTDPGGNFRAQITSPVAKATSTAHSVVGMGSNDTPGSSDLGLFFRLGCNSTAGSRWTGISSYENGTGSRLLALQDLGGNVAIGSTTDDGVNALQVTGSAKVTATTSPFTALVSDALTVAAATSFTLDHATSGTAANGFGHNIFLLAQDSTTVSQRMAVWSSVWADATHATRKGRNIFYASDAANERECLRIETSGSAAMIGFLGSAATAKVAITGSRAGNAALASLLTELASKGLITDSTTA